MKFVKGLDEVKLLFARICSVSAFKQFYRAKLCVMNGIGSFENIVLYCFCASASDMFSSVSAHSRQTCLAVFRAFSLSLNDTFYVMQTSSMLN